MSDYVHANRPQTDHGAECRAPHVRKAGKDLDALTPDAGPGV